MLHRNKGFTLIELMVTLLVLGIVLAAALPSFREAIQNNRVTTQANELSMAFMLARSEAVKLTVPTAICGSSDGETCGAAATWANGFIVFVDQNRDGVRANPAEAVIRAFQSADGGIAFTGPPTFVRYLATGAVDSAAAINFNLSIPSCRGTQSRNFSIARTGRVQITRVACT